MFKNTHRILEQLGFFVSSSIDIGKSDFVGGRAAFVGRCLTQANGASFQGVFDRLHSNNSE
jgi:hypothetical protein